MSDESLYFLTFSRYSLLAQHVAVSCDVLSPCCPKSRQRFFGGIFLVGLVDHRCVFGLDDWLLFFHICFFNQSVFVFLSPAKCDGARSIGRVSVSDPKDQGSNPVRSPIQKLSFFESKMLC